MQADEMRSCRHDEITVRICFCLLAVWRPKQRISWGVNHFFLFIKWSLHYYLILLNISCLMTSASFYKATVLFYFRKSLHCPSFSVCLKLWWILVPSLPRSTLSDNWALHSWHFELQTFFLLFKKDFIVTEWGSLKYWLWNCFNPLSWLQHQENI